MKAKIGDSVIVESERVAQPARRGVIDEILQEDPPRFRIRWEDGHETILSPAAGVARVEPARRTRKAAGAARTEKAKKTRK